MTIADEVRAARPGSGTRNPYPTYLAESGICFGKRL